VLRLAWLCLCATLPGHADARHRGDMPMLHLSKLGHADAAECTASLRFAFARHRVAKLGFAFALHRVAKPGHAFALLRLAWLGFAFAEPGHATPLPLRATLCGAVLCLCLAVPRCAQP